MYRIQAYGQCGIDRLAILRWRYWMITVLAVSLELSNVVDGVSPVAVKELKHSRVQYAVCCYSGR